MKHSWLLSLFIGLCLLWVESFSITEALADEAQNAPALRIVGAVAPDGIKLNSNSTAFEYSFTIEAINDKPISDLKILVSPLVGPDGAQTVLQCKANERSCAGQNFTVDALGVLQVSVNAELGLEGTYAGAITLVYSGKRETTKLSITRARPPIPVEILGLEAVREDPILYGGDPSFWLTLNGTSGQEVSVSLPVLTSLTLSGANNGKFQSPFNKVIVTENERPVAEPLKLKPGELHRYKLTVEGVNTAGEYSANVRLAQKDATPIDKSISIFVKSSALLASVLIGIGVLAGYFIRRYTMKDRPKILLERRVLLTLSEIDATEQGQPPLKSSEKSILDTFRHRLNDLYEEVELGTDRDADALLEEVDKKLSMFTLWTNARRQVEAIQSSALVEPFREEIKGIESFLLRNKPDANQYNEKQAMLDSFEARLRKAIRDDLERRLTNFQEEVNKFHQAGPSPSVLDELRDNLEPKIEQAKLLLQGNQLEESNQLFIAARSDYARILADDMEANINSIKSAPLGFIDNTWSALKTEITNSLANVRRQADPDLAIAAYESTYALYLHRLDDSVRKEIEQRMKSIEENNALSEDEIKGYKASLDDALRSIDISLRKTEAKQFREAAAAYQQAIEKYSTVVASLTQGGQLSAAQQLKEPADVFAGAEIPAGLSFMQAIIAPARQPRARPTTEALLKRLKVNDRLLLVVITLIAIAAGLKLFWVDNAVWGSWSDCLTAVLWGLGLHQVVGPGFEGLLSLKDKLSSIQTK